MGSLLIAGEERVDALEAEYERDEISGPLSESSGGAGIVKEATKVKKVVKKAA